MLDVLAGVHLDFFHATDFVSSEHSKEMVYEVYTQQDSAQKFFKVVKMSMPYVHIYVTN